jgi:RimJ/RimL family protein N-acetyltransferase
VDLDDLPLETHALRIRRFVPEDADELLALSHEDALRTWLPSQVYRDAAHAASTIESLIRAYSSAANPMGGPCVLAIEHRTDRVLVGHVGFSPLGDDVEIGFAIGHRFQRRGYASEAIVAATRWAFQRFPLERIVGITAVANTASRRALVRAKFTHQGERTMPFQGTAQTVSVYELDRGYRM